MPETGLVVGGDSLIGERIAATLRRAGTAVQQTTRRGAASGLAFDLAKPDLSIFKKQRFDFVAFCAAVTGMAACEASPDVTRNINVTGTLAAMRAAADAGAHIVFFSSSQVFDGETPLPTEDAPPTPKNVYGRQKLEVERAIANERLPAAIMRVTKVLSDRPVGMFHGWYQNLAQGKPAVAATNMTLAPVSAQDCADLALALGDGRHTGIWHLSSADELPYEAAALRMAEICGLPPHLVRGEPVTEQQVPDIFRHRYTALQTQKAAKLPGVIIKTASETLDALFGEYARSAAAATP
jgi:dTDP-4-dehydrorhamnose reductase